MVKYVMVYSEEINPGLLVWRKVEQMVTLILRHPLKKGRFETNQNHWLLWHVYAD